MPVVVVEGPVELAIFMPPKDVMFGVLVVSKAKLAPPVESAPVVTELQLPLLYGEAAVTEPPLTATQKPNCSVPVELAVAVAPIGVMVLLCGLVKVVPCANIFMPLAALVEAWNLPVMLV